MSPELRNYIDLEIKVQECLKIGDEFLADHLRDQMDDIWLLLSDYEHEILNSRNENQPEAI